MDLRSSSSTSLHSSSSDRWPRSTGSRNVAGAKPCSPLEFATSHQPEIKAWNLWYKDMTTHSSSFIATKSSWSTESKQICYTPVLFFSMTVTTSFSLKLISPFPPAANSATEWYLSTNSSSFRPVGDVINLLLWQEQEGIRYLRYKINSVYVSRYKN